MWVYISREQAEAKDMKIPNEAITHKYFVGHIAADGIFYCGNSTEKLHLAMKMVNYLNGGKGDLYAGVIDA